MEIAGGVKLQGMVFAKLALATPITAAAAAATAGGISAVASKLRQLDTSRPSWDNRNNIHRERVVIVSIISLIPFSHLTQTHAEYSCSRSMTS